MRLAELATRSGLSTPTIKYYLRLGLLPPGVAQSSTWAEYGDTHVQRLALIRSLTDVAGLRLDQVRQVLAAVDDEHVSLHDSLGEAQWLISPPPEVEPSAAALARVDAWLARQGWRLAEGGPLRLRLASQLEAVESVGLVLRDDWLDEYADALLPVVARDVERMPRGSRAAAVERLVVGTLLLEPVIATIRRMAAEVVSASRS